MVWFGLKYQQRPFLCNLYFASNHGMNDLIQLPSNNTSEPVKTIPVPGRVQKQLRCLSRYAKYPRYVLINSGCVTNVADGCDFIIPPLFRLPKTVIAELVAFVKELE